MADRYIQIANFKWGLDSRKSELLEIPGALIQCQNGFINSGGEIQQRFSFAKSTNTYPQSGGSNTTFGLEAISSGLVTFGSTATPGTLPTGVTYLRCIAAFNNANNTIHMTSVLGSCNYNGNAFVVAEFSDNRVYCFYGKTSPLTLVPEIGVNGVVLTDSTGSTEGLADLATDLTNLLNNISGYTAVANTDPLGNSVNGGVTLKTIQGLHSSFTPSQVSTSGLLTASLINQNTPGGTNLASSLAFTIGASGSGTIAISAPATSGGSGTAILTGGSAIAWAGSANATAAAVVTAINNNTTQGNATGYSALVQSGSLVTIYAPTSWGALANGFTLTVTAASMTITSASTALTGLLSPTSINFGNGGSAAMTAIASGSQGTLSYSWAITGDVYQLFSVNPTNTQTVTISVVQQRGFVHETSCTIACTITDTVLGSITIYGTASNNF